MHNQHILIVNAENGEEAVDEALGRIENWGDDNNWRSAIGALSATGEVYLTPAADRSCRFPAAAEAECLEMVRDIPRFFANLNVPVLGALEQDAHDLMRVIVGVPARQPDTGEVLAARPAVAHAVIVNYLQQRLDALGNRGCTLWTSPGLRSWQLDSDGLTVLDETAGTPEQRWAVLIDMHS